MLVFRVLTERIVNEEKRIENEGEGEHRLQNQATEEEKCFIIQADILYLSGAAEGIRGMHQQTCCVVTGIQY